MIHYLDNAATTPVRPEAVQAAVEAMTKGWGNPSSRYELGTKAAAQMKEWRGNVAQALGCLPEELFFTSCGTEGDNWAIQSALEVNRRRGKHIITTAIEHAAVLEPCRELVLNTLVFEIASVVFIVRYGLSPNERDRILSVIKNKIKK